MRNRETGEKGSNDRLLKALRAVNFLSGKSVNEADLKKHRRAVEWAGRLTSPKTNIEVSTFKVDDILCEKVKPEYAYNPQYAILYAHGGGYISGGLDYASILAAKMATATGFAAYSFAYRLAPEYPYPAALEDTLAVWEYLTGKYSAEHILLAGDSAGGNLALCLIQKLNKEGRPIPGELLLFSPWTDMTCNSASYKKNAELDPILTKEYVSDAAAAYIGGNGERDDARFSPIFGDFSDFPHTLIMAGKNEILLDDSIRLKDRITEAGGKAQLDIEESGWHVYQQMPIPIARRAMKRLSKFVSTQVYGGDTGSEDR